MSQLSSICRLTALSLAALVFAGAASAQTTVKVGFANVQPHSSAGDLSGPFTPSGLSLDVKNQSTLCLSLSRALTDAWEVELAAGYPPTHDVAIKVNNAALPASAQAANGQIGAKVRQINPTLFANYKFGDKSSALRPFIGVGVNYTSFDKADSTAAGNTLNGGPTSLSLKDSWGLALQGGLSYRINDKWSLSGSVATAQVKTTLTTNTLGTVRTTDIKFRPTVFVLAAGYSF